MASDKRTAYLEAYKQLANFIPFLSSFFRTNPQDIVFAESVKIDVMRGKRKIAPVISNITQRGGKLEKSQYVSKEYTPPVVAVSSDFAASDLIDKAFGVSEYDSADQDYMLQLQSKIKDTMVEIEGQINRNIEYQASQILQNAGGISLYDDNGQIAYTIDFLAKDTHFPTTSISWSDDASDPDSDLKALYDVIKKDGFVSARNVIFGKTALKNYLRNSFIQDKFDIRNINAGTIAIQERNPDVTLLGEFIVDNVRMVGWTYDGYYNHPSTDTITSFVGDDKVIMLPDPGSINLDFRKIYCKVPTVTGVDPRFASVVPTNLNLDNRAYTARVWVDGNADALDVELKTRPLLIPVSIDAFGCLDTEI